MKEIYHCFRNRKLHARAEWLSQCIRLLLDAKMLHVRETGRVLVYFQLLHF